MTEMDIIHNYGKECELLAFSFMLEIAKLYKDQPDKIIEIMQERINELKG